MDRIFNKIRNNEIIKYMMKNSGMIIALFTLLITVASFVFKMFNYFYLRFYMLYFNVPSKYVTLEGKGIVYDFLQYISMMILFSICSYVVYFLRFMNNDHRKIYKKIEQSLDKNERNKKMLKEIRRGLKIKHKLIDPNYSARGFLSVIFIILNISIAICFTSSLFRSSILLFCLEIILIALVFAILETIFALFVSIQNNEKKPNHNSNTTDKKIDESAEQEIDDVLYEQSFKSTGSYKVNLIRVTLLILTFIIVFISILFGYFGYTTAGMIKTFDLAENNQYAIIQRFDGKCLLVDVDVKGKVLTINTSEQKVVSEEGLLYKSTTFDKVKVNRNS